MKMENLTNPIVVKDFYSTDNFNIKQVIFLTGIFIFLFSCGPKKPFEFIEEVYPDGTSKLIKYYKTDTKEVLISETHYYQDGQKKMEGSFKNDKRDGQWTYWYPDGKLWSKGFYKEGVNHGLKSVWHENGQKYYEGQMTDNKRTGIWKFWDPDGTLLKEINYDKKNI